LLLLPHSGDIQILRKVTLGKEAARSFAGERTGIIISSSQENLQIRKSRLEGGLFSLGGVSCRERVEFITNYRI
jgi:hypothetical protein